MYNDYNEQQHGANCSYRSVAPIEQFHLQVSCTYRAYTPIGQLHIQGSCIYRVVVPILQLHLYTALHLKSSCTLRLPYRAVAHILQLHNRLIALIEQLHLLGNCTYKEMDTFFKTDESLPYSNYNSYHVFKTRLTNAQKRFNTLSKYILLKSHS